MKYLLLINLTVLLWGCGSQSIEVGQQVLQNDTLKDAGQEVLDGGKGLLQTGKEAVAGVQKVVSGGKVIFIETQKIMTDLQSQVEPEAAPESGNKVWLKVLTEGCLEDTKQCTAWLDEASGVWKRLPGEVKNLDMIPDLDQGWAVELEQTVSDWTIKTIDEAVQN